jgi:hypothetical protein
MVGAQLQNGIIESLQKHSAIGCYLSFLIPLGGFKNNRRALKSSLLGMPTSLWQYICMDKPLLAAFGLQSLSTARTLRWALDK